MNEETSQNKPLRQETLSKGQTLVRYWFVRYRFVRYLGPFLKWNKDELQQMD